MFFKTLLFFVITFMVSKSRCNYGCGIPPTKCRLDDIYCMEEQERGFRQWYQSKKASNFHIANINPYSIDKLELQVADKRIDLINVEIYGIGDSYLNIYNVVVNKDIYSYNNTLTHNLCLHADGSVLVDLLTGKEVIDDCPLQIDFDKATAWNSLDAVRVNRCNGKPFLKTYNFNCLVGEGTGVIRTGLKRVQENLNLVEQADFEKVLLDSVVKLCTQVVYNNYEILTAVADLDKLFE